MGRPLLAAGVPIAVVAPSHAYDPERLAAGIDLARAHGHDLHPFPGMLAPHRYFAASHAQRLAQLVEALTDPRWGAVWLARGGSGLTHLLDDIPWSRVGRKPVLGFSDAVALHAGLWRSTDAVIVHAPVLHSLSVTDADSVAHLFALLDGARTPPLRGEAWVAGEADGPLLGGNLCVLAALCGTPHQLDARDAILVLEDIGETPYRIERTLRQLIASGVLRDVAGVALGTFVGCAPPPEADWTLREAVLEHLAPLGVPVLGGLPIGHGPENRAFRWGARATIRGDVLTVSEAD